MQDEKFYNEYGHWGDSIKPGEGIKLERHISFNEYHVDLAPVVQKGKDALTAERAESEQLEKAVFTELNALSQKWVEQAAQTLLLDRALDYLHVNPVKHTSNEWTADQYGFHTISNMVYKMNYRISEQTSYDRKLGRSIPTSWDVSWNVSFNVIERNARYNGNLSIAGQDRKRYTDKAAAERYVQGRIDAYAHLFKDISPPIPENKKRLFMVNGLLLPGYSLEPHKPTPDELLAFVDENDVQDFPPDKERQPKKATLPKKHPRR